MTDGAVQTVFNSVPVIARNPPPEGQMAVALYVTLTPTAFSQEMAVSLYQLGMSQVCSLVVDNSANALPIAISAGSAPVPITVPASGGGVFPVFSAQGSNFVLQVSTQSAPVAPVQINFQALNYPSPPASWAPVATVDIANATIAVTQAQAAGKPWNISGGVTQSGAWNVGQSGAWTVSADQSGAWNVTATQSGAWSINVNNSTGSPANITGPVTQSGAWNVGQSGAWTVTANQSGAWNVTATQSGAWSVNVSNSTLSITGPVTQSGAWNVGQSGTWNVVSTQSGTWNINASQTGSWAVNVNNTGGSPVNISGPVTQAGAWNINSVQSGAWTVAQSGTWNINAVQSGTWNVAQSGAWNVNITNASLTIAGNINANITNANIVVQGNAGGGSSVQITPTHLGDIIYTAFTEVALYPSSSPYAIGANYASYQMVTIQASPYNTNAVNVQMFSNYLGGWVTFRVLNPGEILEFGNQGGVAFPPNDIAFQSVTTYGTIIMTIWGYP